ncbi:MAG: hypothetical protein ACD_32C00109G0007 [uncultured bacterium]|nr:MAG: hypothetical protein ACD_32C00109G0007 [uncultured bacterium]
MNGTIIFADFRYLLRWTTGSKFISIVTKLLKENFIYRLLSAPVV